MDENEVGLFFHDGTERPINRPQDPEEQKLYYSGKQKKHTVKNDIVIDEPCKIRFLTDTVSPFAIATSLKLNFGTIAWGSVEKTCLPMKSDRYPRSLYGYRQER